MKYTKNTTKRELLAYLDDTLPKLSISASKKSWKTKSAKVRKDLLKLFFRGHPKDLLKQKVKVKWRGEIKTGKGYKIRKLIYEGYPGLWIPALLYEPDNLGKKVPAVLNAFGHGAGGKADEEQQARCINLAKRGILALNYEFLGMGELGTGNPHHRIGQLDLCGISGVGVFYLIMKRALDILVSHPYTDAQRVAMTGLSGGGWQTILLSSLDQRIKAAVPVAGHSAVWQRSHYPQDIGDQEQVPSDFCTVADYDTLTSMLAPRPELLIYNRYDTCCFQSRRAKRSTYIPAKPVFELLNCADRLHFYDCVYPRSHHYAHSNRKQFYSFLNTYFKLDTPNEDLLWEDEILTEFELATGLPPDNATLLTLARDAMIKHRKTRAKKRGKMTPKLQRKQLKELIRLPELNVEKQYTISNRRKNDLTVYRHLLKIGSWTVPITEQICKNSKSLKLILSDSGQNSPLVQKSITEDLEQQHSVITADLFGSGLATLDSKYHMLLACSGNRSLGIQVAQLLVLLKWIRTRRPKLSCHVTAGNLTMPIVTLIGAALKPKLFSSLTTTGLVPSLDRIIDWPIDYADVPTLFCFGLLEKFDIPELIELSAPVPFADTTRGPLRKK